MDLVGGYRAGGWRGVYLAMEEIMKPDICLYHGPGTWLLKCAICGRSVGVTAAGRLDDPSEVRLPCKARGEA